MNYTTRCLMCNRPIHLATVERLPRGIDNLPEPVPDCYRAGNWVHYIDKWTRQRLTVFVGDAMAVYSAETET